MPICVDVEEYKYTPRIDWRLTYHSDPLYLARCRTREASLGTSLVPDHAPLGLGDGTRS